MFFYVMCLLNFIYYHDEKVHGNHGENQLLTFHVTFQS